MRAAPRLLTASQKRAGGSGGGRGGDGEEGAGRVRCPWPVVRGGIVLRRVGAPRAENGLQGLFELGVALFFRGLGEVEEGEFFGGAAAAEAGGEAAVGEEVGDGDL